MGFFKKILGLFGKKRQKFAFMLDNYDPSLFMTDYLNRYFIKNAEDTVSNISNAVKAADDALCIAERLRDEMKIAMKPDIRNAEYGKYTDHIMAVDGIEKNTEGDMLYGQKKQAFNRFIEDAYYLYIAISKANIPVNSIGAAFVEKAFHSYCKSMTEFFRLENIIIKDANGNDTALHLDSDENEKPAESEEIRSQLPEQNEKNVPHDEQESIGPDIPPNTDQLSGDIKPERLINHKGIF